MGLFDQAIKNGINRAVNKTVEKAVEKKVTEAVTTTMNKASNQAANTMTNQTAQAAGTPGQPANPQNLQNSGAQFGGFFANLAGAAQGFANEAAKNMKLCPACGAPAALDKKFCSECGAGLPEQAAAQSSVCTNCGKQNDVGTKFCADCGAKLPAALAQEEAARAKSAAALAKWDAWLPQYPKWDLGGRDVELEECGEENGHPYYGFYISGVGANELERYKQLLKQNGFVTAGQYPSESQLFKRINGAVYNFHSDEAFSGGPNNLSVYFFVREPDGGFDYKAPVSPSPKGLKDLFKF